MARISRSLNNAIIRRAGAALPGGLLIAFLAVLGGIALGQDKTPDQVLGTQGGEYDLFTPAEVVAAGGGGSGGTTPLSDATPKADSGAGSAGTATAASRGDHAHPATPDELPAQSASNAGRVLSRSTQASGVLWDPPADVVDRGLPLKTGKAGEFLRVTSDASGIEWAEGSGLPSRTGKGGDYLRVTEDASGIEWVDVLSDATPQNNAKTGSGTPGTAKAASRADHVHRAAFIPYTLTPKRESGNGLAGTDPAFSRGDHVHPATVGVAVPKAASGTGSAGTSANTSREDHVHPAASSLPAHTDANAGDFLILSSQPSNVQPLWAEAHNAVLTGLPTLTGHGGNFLAVNAAATGVEWKAGGGGGGAGAAVEIARTSIVATRSQWVASTDNTVTLAYPTGTAEADFDDKTIGAFIFPQVARESALRPAGAYQAILGLQDPDTLKESSRFTITGTVGDALTQVDFNSDGIKITLPITGWNARSSASDRIILQLLQLTGGGGGGGGGTGPSIPTPTAAGALKHLRVNAAGAAYELADPPDLEPLQDELAALDGVTIDLAAPPAMAQSWTKNTIATAATISFIAGSDLTPDISSTTAHISTVAAPGATWPPGYILVKLKDSADRSHYRIDFVGRGDDAGENYYFNGNDWRQVTPSAGAQTGFLYYAAGFDPDFNGPGDIGQGVGNVELQTTDDTSHLGRSTFAGDPLKVSAWAKAGLGNGTSGQYLSMNNDGDAPQWRNPPAPLASNTPSVAKSAGESGSGTSASRWDHVHPLRKYNLTVKTGSMADCCLNNFLVEDSSAEQASGNYSMPFREPDYTVTGMVLYLWWDTTGNDNTTRTNFTLPIGGLRPGAPKLAAANETLQFQGGHVNSSLNGAEIKVWSDGGFEMRIEVINTHGGRTVNYRLDYIMEHD